MHIRLRLDGGCVRRWHVDLSQALLALPNRHVSYDLRPAPKAWPMAADWLFQFETRLHRIPARHSNRVSSAALPLATAAADSRPDVIVDLCGDVVDAAPRIWTISHTELALLGSILNRHVPRITITEQGRTLSAGRPGTERPDVLLSAFDDALGGLKRLLIALVQGTAPQYGAPLAEDPTPQHALGLLPFKLGLFAIKALATKIFKRLYRAVFHVPNWRVGWRRMDGADVIDLQAHPDTGWINLPDDGQRFYADPFIFAHADKAFLFVEDFPHATQKGLISAVELGPHGPIGTPVPVLECAHHLSYPFVFAAEGEVWMIPETCSARTIELYRATAFPSGWVREAVLVADIVAGDATLVQHQGQWWMFATVQHEGGAYSDHLHLWSAPSFKGPWTAHAHNPVLIDMASARPAGQVVARDGELWRPVQDCRAGYGAALHLARITKLDDAGFAQEVVAQIGPGPHWAGTCLHTLNSGAGFEVIDGSHRTRRF